MGNCGIYVRKIAVSGNVLPPGCAAIENSFLTASYITGAIRPLPISVLITSRTAAGRAIDVDSVT